ncbi:MAG: NAD-dependent epimerase [Myxococcota bacterium]
MATVLITGAAGFIGYSLSEVLLARGDHVVGVDNVNPYYDPKLKEARIERASRHEHFRFERCDIANAEALKRVFDSCDVDAVVNLAAQAGVRYSLTHPEAYMEANIIGFLNVLEMCRHREIGHLVFASSSSVYGANEKSPFSVKDSVDHPVSLYAATKKSNELMAHSYAHLFGVPCTGLRFFTVYGPWGRPDMALFLFSDAILAGKPIQVFNHGNMSRDFTYIDDIVNGIVRVLDQPPTAGGRPDHPGTSHAPFRVFNIGNGNPVRLLRMVELLEEALGAKAERILMPMQPGDVESTHADVTAISAAVGYEPTTPFEVGVRRFADWYRSYTQR